MKPQIEIVSLQLKNPFRIAHGESSYRDNVILDIREGFGEGALPPYYEFTAEEVISYLNRIDFDDLLREKPLALEESLKRIPPGPAPARAALDLTLHDLWARDLGYPLYRLWGAHPRQFPLSSLTVSIPRDETELRHVLQEVKDYPILKLKLGTGNIERDEEIVRVAREVSSANLCVDANGAWTIDESARIIPRLMPSKLLFIEQPVPSTDHSNWQQLRAILPPGSPPLIADESVRQTRDIFVLANVIDGINIKLTKAGGLREARHMIILARMLGLKVMIGCMIESAVGITAATHLAPFADFADLDAGLLIANDPFVGMTLEKGNLIMPDEPGLGVKRRG